MREEIVWLMDELGSREDVRAAIVTGRGKVFSAGADLHERAHLDDEPGEYLRHSRATRESFFALTDCAVPVIAAVNVPAIGAGYATAACADFLILSDDAWIQMPEIERGLLGVAKFLSMHFGRSRARYLLFTGEKIDAPELHRLGVADALVSAISCCREPVTSPCRSQRRARWPYGGASRCSTPWSRCLPETGTPSNSATRTISKSDDARKAREAFLERREPRFTGR